MAWVVSGLESLPDALARKSDVLFLARSSGILSGELSTPLRFVLYSFSLLSFHRFTFPSAGHPLIIVGKYWNNGVPPSGAATCH